VPVFWSPVHFTNQPGTMGILCDPEHKALEYFPTDYHSDWQWWDLNINSVVFKIDDMPKDLKPIVQVIDNFSRNQKLATIIELKTGKSNMIICSMDLTSNLDLRPQAKQLRYSLLQYMKSGNFKPEVEVQLEQLENLFNKATAMTYASVVHSDSFQQGYPAQNAIDGNPETIWSTAWSPQIKEHPHEIVIDLKKEHQIRGFTYLSRQDGNPNGRIREYEFYISNDGKNWNGPIVKDEFKRNDSLQKISFYGDQSIYSQEKIKGRYIRLVAISGFGNDPYTTIAELDILTD
jgi:hypothetical protein